MSKEKLKIELYRYENVLFGKILEQDENLRDKDCIFEKDGFKLISISFSYLSSNCFYMRGVEEQYDNKIFVYDYETKKECDAMVSFIKEALNYVNNNSEVEEKDKDKVTKII